MQGGLSEQLRTKLSAFDISTPYVWKLRLSEADFSELQFYLESIVNTDGKTALVDSDNALLTVIYIAEWYKRRYCGGNRCYLIDGLNLEKVWTNASLNKDLYLYQAEKGNNRRLYSIYVLGGLAIRHELQRSDSLRFLKGLCRIYHGEDFMLENFDEPDRAIAFRESIRQRHCLYEYMREILSGGLPFSEEDLNDDASDVNRFMAMIKAADEEVLRVKFRLEWIVHFSPDDQFMSRRLVVWLKPEEVGEGLHQNLRYDRVHLWGLPDAEKQKHLYIYIRFKDGNIDVAPSTADHPIITYLNGMTDFIAFGVEKYVVVKNIPSTRFDRVDIVARDDDGREYLAQSQNVAQYLQLWRRDDYSDSWTSYRNSQRQTALLFSNCCKLKEKTAKFYSKPFQNKEFGIGDLWNWVYIHDSVSFFDERGGDQCRYNRIGYDQVTTKLYDSIINYIGGGKVRHCFIDDPDVSDGYETEELPLIFGKEDIIVRHFTTKDDTLNEGSGENTIAERIEYKQNNGRYAEWTASNEPPYGKTILRVTVKGNPHLFPVVYLPKLNEGCPIERDYDATVIRYRDFNGKDVVLQDEIPRDGIVLSPTLPVQYGEGRSYCVVDVYRPTLVKEVLLDGKIVRYLNGEDKLLLPYIFKNRVQLNDFSQKGYQTYDCKKLGNIYTKSFINIEGNPSVGEAAMNAWRDDKRYRGTLLDEMAPDCLVVFFGNSKENSLWEDVAALYWDYDANTEPEPIDPVQGAALKDCGLIFQSIVNATVPECNFAEEIDDDPWAWDGITESKLKCFEVANRFGIYFFLMRPLRELKTKDIPMEIYEPLLKERNDDLSPEDRRGLLRLAQEFGFDWHDLNISIDNE